MLKKMGEKLGEAKRFLYLCRQIMKEGKKIMSRQIYFEPTEETLREMQEKFAPVADDRYLYTIQEGEWDIEKVNKFKSNLQLSLIYTSKEYERIKKFKESYNQEKPSNHKKYFSTVVELMSKMRSTLSAYKDILEGFRKKKKRGRKRRKDMNNYNSNTLFNGPYSQVLFGWDVYDDKAVKDLQEDLNAYLKLSNECLQVCNRIIEDEQNIRRNPDLACPRYEYSFERSVKGNAGLIRMMKECNANIDNDIVDAMEKAEDVRKLIASMFHEINREDWNTFCACKVIHDGRKVGLTAEESMLFGKDNVETVIKVRTLLDHILELVTIRDDAIGWKNTLNGKFVMHLLFWCGWDGTKNENMLNYITKRCKGKIGVVKMGAVMYEKRKLPYLNNEDRRKQQEAFNQQMDDFVESILTNTEEREA